MSASNSSREARRRLEDGVARADEEEDEPALPVSRLPYQLVLDARALLVRVDEEAEHVLCRGAAMARGRCGVLLLLFWSWGQGGVIGLLPWVSTRHMHNVMEGDVPRS